MLHSVLVSDAILLTESETESLEPSNLDTSLEKSTEQITFKILNSNKDIAYSLRKVGFVFYWLIRGRCI